jgi:hypothetical protein
MKRGHLERAAAALDCAGVAASKRGSASASALFHLAEAMQQLIAHLVEVEVGRNAEGSDEK